MTSTSPGGEQPGRSARAGVAAGLVRGPSGRSGAAGRLTSTLGWAVRWLVAWALATLVLGLVIAVLPGLTASRPAAVALAVLCVVAVRAALTPVVRALTALLPWALVLLIALVLQAGLLWLGLTVAPGVGVSSFWAAFWASWVTAALAVLVGWVLDVQDEDAFLAHLVRQATRGRRGRAAPQRTQAPGLLVVQLDGAPWPVIRWMLAAGNLPTLARWVRTTHRAREWTVRVPSTTPVSQAGFLHGRTDDLPAFRWYDRDAGRLVVANHPPDAALIQQRLSDGTGLLADGGASISNLFSGDAPISLLTMSGLARPKEGLGPSSSYAGFLTSPYGLVRGLVRTVGEILKELYQARQQRRRGVEPRISRHGSYVALRGFTNVLQRDLNLALVVEQLMAGTPSVFVDFLDYDEIAHHAGPTRPESLRALEGVDRILGQIERVLPHAPRPYRVVVVSDHGQSQGATFRQRFGVGLEDVVRELMAAAGRGSDRTVTAVGATADVEGWGPLNTFLSQVSQEGGASGKLVGRAVAGRREDGAVALGPLAAEEQALAERPDVVAVGSGNLGAVWFARAARRLLLEDVEQAWPGLVQGLAEHPGVSFVVVLSARGPVAVGARGRRLLETGEVTGEDPTAPFGPQAAADFARCARFGNAPDLYVNSCFDPDTQEVAAFEELVGCHGGVGGWQTQGTLVHPAEWEVTEELVGAEAVHRQLVRWLEDLGQRRHLPRLGPVPSVPAQGVASEPDVVG